MLLSQRVSLVCSPRSAYKCIVVLIVSWLRQLLPRPHRQDQVAEPSRPGLSRGSAGAVLGPGLPSRAWGSASTLRLGSTRAAPPRGALQWGSVSTAA